MVAGQSKRYEYNRLRLPGKPHTCRLLTYDDTPRRRSVRPIPVRSAADATHRFWSLLPPASGGPDESAPTRAMEPPRAVPPSRPAPRGGRVLPVRRSIGAPTRRSPAAAILSGSAIRWPPPFGGRAHHHRRRPAPSSIPVRRPRRPGYRRAYSSMQRFACEVWP
jgi:hypothetical protein